MIRALCPVNSRLKRKKILKAAKGYRGRAKNCIKIARLAVQKAALYRYRDRKTKVREFRTFLIERINAFARNNNMKYSELMYKLHEKLGVNMINRSMILELALRNPDQLKSLCS